MVAVRRLIPVVLVLAGLVMAGIGGERDYRRHYGGYATYCDTPTGESCAVPGYPPEPAPLYAVGAALVLVGAVGVALVGRR